MAKYIGLLTSDSRGKVGGIIMSRATGATTLKAHRAPKLPSSLLQQQCQANMATAVAAWRRLSSANQASWNTMAASVFYTNSLGTTYSPTALQLWTQAWINAQLFNTVPPSTFPIASRVPPPILSVGALNFAGSLKFNADIFGAVYPQYISYSAGFIIPSSVSYVRSARVRSIATATTGAVINVTTNYYAAYGNIPSTGMRIAISAMGIDYPSYISGPRLIVPVDVT